MSANGKTERMIPIAPFPTSLPVAVVRKQVCGVRDGDHGQCTLPAGHGNGSVVHTEMRDGKLWAQWRSVLPEDECVCHVPRACKVHP